MPRPALPIERRAVSLAVRLRAGLLTRSCSLSHSLAVSLTRCLTHSLSHSLAVSLTCCLTHSLTHLLSHSLSHCLTHSLSHSLSHSLALSALICDTVVCSQGEHCQHTDPLRRGRARPRPIDGGVQGGGRGVPYTSAAQGELPWPPQHLSMHTGFTGCIQPTTAPLHKPTTTLLAAHTEA